MPEINFELRPDLAARLPQGETELRELLNRAVENELSGRTASAMGKKGQKKGITSPQKKITSVANGKLGGRPKGSKNKPKSQSEKQEKTNQQTPPENAL